METVDIKVESSHIIAPKAVVFYVHSPKLYEHLKNA